MVKNEIDKLWNNDSPDLFAIACLIENQTLVSDMNFPDVVKYFSRCFKKNLFIRICSWKHVSMDMYAVNYGKENDELVKFWSGLGGDKNNKEHTKAQWKITFNKYSQDSSLKYKFRFSPRSNTNASMYSPEDSSNY